MAFSRTAYGSSVVLIGMMTLGCAVDATETASAEPASSDTTALLVANRLSTPEGVRTEIAARFLRMQRGPVDEQALRMAGAEELPQMGCRVVTDLRSTGAGPARSVAMLDVGSVSFESGGSRLALAPREVPDPVGLVSGVLYFARANDPDALAPGEHVSLLPDRMEEALLLSAFAPQELSELRVQHRESNPDNTFSVVGDSLELAWSTQTSSPGDVVMFDFGAPSEPRFRCAMPDDGMETVQLPSQMFGNDFAMTAHRLRHESNQMVQGRTEVRIDIARTYKISRR